MFVCLYVLCLLDVHTELCLSMKYLYITIDNKNPGSPFQCAYFGHMFKLSQAKYTPYQIVSFLFLFAVFLFGFCESSTNWQFNAHTNRSAIEYFGCRFLHWISTCSFQINTHLHRTIDVCCVATALDFFRHPLQIKFEYSRYFARS